jgi:hypothetical protein
VAISPRPEQQARINYLPLPSPQAGVRCRARLSARNCRRACIGAGHHRPMVRRSIAAPAEARKGDHRSQIDRALGHEFCQGLMQPAAPSALCRDHSSRQEAARRGRPWSSFQVNEPSPQSIQRQGLLAISGRFSSQPPRSHQASALARKKWDRLNSVNGACLCCVAT